MRTLPLEHLEDRLLLSDGAEDQALVQAACRTLCPDTVPMPASGRAEAADAAPAALSALLSETSATARAPLAEAPNAPIGLAKGIYPGRVVWVYDPRAATWDGLTGYHWQDAYTNQTVVQEMLAHGLCGLTGQADAVAAWDALFRYFNRQRGLGDVGYRAGERIAIKINLNVHDSQSAPPNNYADLTPAMLFSLLDQLVNHAHVPQQDIYVYDSIKSIPDKLFNKCHAAFPDVHYQDKSGGNGRERVLPSATRLLRWSDGGGSDYLPRCVVESKYMINLAIVKKHDSAGITGCAKNHFGSFLRRPDASGYANVHNSLAGYNSTPGSYRALADLLGHEHLGGKTILNIVDGIYGGWNWGTANSQPTRWVLSPFDNRWLASVFLSQDPVAIDSVLCDLIRAEDQAYFARTGRYHGPNAPVASAVDDYLHEAALCGQQGARRYDPEGDGIALQSLGVHEHWNNPVQKQYSRNLGTGPGIELFQVKAPSGIQPADLPDGQAHRPYLPVIFHAEGSAPITWTVSAGSLPPGMYLDAATGTYGGTPLAAGTFHFTITATNTFGSSSRTCSHTILFNPSPTISGTSGNDAFRLCLDSTGASLELWDELTQEQVCSWPLSALNSLTIDAGHGEDRLTIELGKGLPIPIEGIQFNGGQNTDTLIVQGTPPVGSMSVGESSVSIGGSLISADSVEQISVSLPGHTLLTSLDISGGCVSLGPSPGRVLCTESLSIAGEGTLDLADGALIVTATAQTRQEVYDRLASYIRTARRYGDWRRIGLTSSRAGLCAGLAVAINDRGGESGGFLSRLGPFDLSLNDVLVKYTYNGDVNLDGLIDADDYFRVDSGFLSQVGGYCNGDLNLDGKVNADDYFLIDLAYLEQRSPLAVQCLQLLRTAGVAAQPGLPGVVPTTVDVFSIRPVRQKRRAPAEDRASGDPAIWA